MLEIRNEERVVKFKMGIYSNKNQGFSTKQFSLFKYKYLFFFV